LDLGKQARRIRVVKVDVLPAGYGAAAIRVYLPTALWCVPGRWAAAPAVTAVRAQPVEAQLARQGGRHGRHQGELTRPTTDRRTVAGMKSFKRILTSSRPWNPIADYANSARVAD